MCGSPVIRVDEPQALGHHQLRFDNWAMLQGLSEVPLLAKGTLGYTDGPPEMGRGLGLALRHLGQSGVARRAKAYEGAVGPRGSAGAGRWVHSHRRAGRAGAGGGGDAVQL